AGRPEEAGPEDGRGPRGRAGGPAVDPGAAPAGAAVAARAAPTRPATATDADTGADRSAPAGAAAMAGSRRVLSRPAESPLSTGCELSWWTGVRTLVPPTAPAVDHRPRIAPALAAGPDGPRRRARRA